MIAEPERQPAAVYHWKDRDTEAEGWVVIDRVVNGVAGGGTFMHPQATQQEVEDVARNMSRKFTVTDPQIGGAKAGIRFSHEDSKQREEVLRGREEISRQRLAMPVGAWESSVYERDAVSFTGWVAWG